MKPGIARYSVFAISTRGMENLITTVTLNPCIDKMVTIDSFTYGGMNRILHSRIDVAGKGNNVAVVYCRLGGEAICTGINYRERGDIVVNYLEENQVAYDFVTVDGEVRINHKIFDRSKRVVTELNESGHPVPMEALELLKDKLINHCRNSHILVLSGSIPRGVPVTIYRELLKAVSHLSIKTILDTEGSLLLEGIKEKPYIIKPNLFELETALDTKLTSHQEIIRAAQFFLDKGVKIIGISLGKEGAIIVDENHAYYSPGLKVDVKGTAGAGDSMVGGFCYAMDKGLDLKGMLRYGIAAATASVMREGTLLCTKEGFESILPMVKVEKLL